MNAKILTYDGSHLTLEPECDLTKELLRKQSGTVEFRLVDGRIITPEQRKKIFATIRDISDWCGHDPEEVRCILTWDFRSLDGRADFSLSDVERSTATEFISYLIEFCLHWNVPTRDSLRNRADSIDQYLYQCLAHRKCAVCNLPADIHHVDAIGMGRDRSTIVHTGMNAIALCRKHHQEAHTMGKAFFETYHIHGIPLDSDLCRRLNLNTKSQKASQK